MFLFNIEIISRVIQNYIEIHIFHICLTKKWPRYKSFEETMQCAFFILHQKIYLGYYKLKFFTSRADISPNHYTRQTNHIFMNNKQNISFKLKQTPHVVQLCSSFYTVDRDDNLYRRSLLCS